MSSQRIVFLDVDGTLIDSGERMAVGTADAIRSVRANGHLVYLCTGRAAIEVPKVVRAIGFDGIISAGGGFAEIGDELVITRTMPPAAAERMTRFFESAGFDFYLQAYRDVYPSAGVRDRFVEYLLDDLRRETGAEPSEAARAAIVEHPAMEAFAVQRPYVYEGIAKAIFLGDDQRAFARAWEGLHPEFHVITGTIPHLGEGSGEVSFGGVNKGSTILQLLELLGLPAAAAIGIGDSSNDVEMFDVCGVAVAMGNASDAIKARAGEVTDGVLDDGVANALRRHGLV